MSLAQSLRCISSGYDKCQLCADDYVGRAVRQKTHTFHLLVGGAIVSLRIDGHVVVSPIMNGVGATCQKLLG